MNQSSKIRKANHILKEEPRAKPAGTRSKTRERKTINKRDAIRERAQRERGEVFPKRSEG